MVRLDFQIGHVTGDGALAGRQDPSDSDSQTAGSGIGCPATASSRGRGSAGALQKERTLWMC